jgi:hypothetical protein
VCRFGRQRPEVPLHVVAAQTRVRGALLRVDEVGELHGIADEEHGGVVAHHVEVALFGVELQRESAHITPGVGRAELTGNGGEASQHRGLLARLQEVGLRVLGDVRGDFEFTESAGSLGVGAALGHTLTVEASKLLDQRNVVEQQRSVRSDAQRVSVRFPRRTGLGGRCLRTVVASIFMICMLRHNISFNRLISGGATQPAITATGEKCGSRQVQLIDRLSAVHLSLDIPTSAEHSSELVST